MLVCYVRPTGSLKLPAINIFATNIFCQPLPTATVSTLLLAQQLYQMKNGLKLPAVIVSRCFERCTIRYNTRFYYNMRSKADM